MVYHTYILYIIIKYKKLEKEMGGGGADEVKMDPRFSNKVYPRKDNVF